MRATFQVRDNTPSDPHTEQLGVDGYIFKSADGLDLAQFRRDGFTYNRLKPYSSWEEILPSALTLWAVYAEIAHPLLITRLGLRYINRIKLPYSGALDLQEYIMEPPRIPKALPQDYSSFLTRVVLEETKHKTSAIVTQALEPPIEPGSVTLLLDIDAFAVDERGFSQNAFREVYHALHALKNDIFFNSITEKTARLYA